MVPQPAVHKLIFGSFLALCPHEVFVLAYCCHVFGRQFVPATDRVRSISTCPTGVLLVPPSHDRSPITDTQISHDKFWVTGKWVCHWYGIPKVPPSPHHHHPLYILFLITGPLFPPILVGLRVGHGSENLLFIMNR